MKENHFMKIKENWYNVVVKAKNPKILIQYIVKYEDSYLVASKRRLTLEEINDIKLENYNFKTYKEVIDGV